MRDALSGGEILLQLSHTAPLHIFADRLMEGRIERLFRRGLKLLQKLYIWNQEEKVADVKNGPQRCPLSSPKSAKARSQSNDHLQEHGLTLQGELKSQDTWVGSFVRFRQYF